MAGPRFLPLLLLLLSSALVTAEWGPEDAPWVHSDGHTQYGDRETQDGDRESVPSLLDSFQPRRAGLGSSTPSLGFSLPPSSLPTPSPASAGERSPPVLRPAPGGPPQSFGPLVPPCPTVTFSPLFSTVASASPPHAGYPQASLCP